MPKFETAPHQRISPVGKRRDAILYIGTGLAVCMLVGGFICIATWSSGDDPVTPSVTGTDNQTIDTKNKREEPQGMAFVPGGEFMMGSDTGDEYSRPAHKVTVKPFYFDLTEVTNEEYKRFVDASNRPPPPSWVKGTFPNGRAKFPVTGVTWDDANAFAVWCGKRLPTETEWEFAARGSDGRAYPWGNEWNAEYANADNQLSGMREVGQGGKSPFGLLDMSGNAWEWTASEAVAYPNGKTPPSNSAEPRIIRGGYWGSPKKLAVMTYRAAWGAVTERNYQNTGFRCAKDADPQ